VKELRLLERISRWEEGGERTNLTQVDILIQSVTHHLRRLLNTRQGSVQLDPAFGVPDFTNVAGGLAAGSTRDIEEALQCMVQRYEPRLKSPRITLTRESSDVLTLRFTLDGMLEVEQRDIPLQLSTTVGANGQVNIA